MINRGVDQINAADQVVLVVEFFDEVAESFGSIGREMKYILNAQLRKYRVDQFMVDDASLDKPSPGIYVLYESSAQVI